MVVGSICPRNCTGHGSCDELSATCVCDSGYSGSDCGLAVASSTAGCPNSCSRRGNCAGGVCVCSGGYGGADCSFTCPSRCTTPNGVCVGTSCECSRGWSGLDCSQPVHLVQVSEALFSGSSKIDGGTCVQPTPSTACSHANPDPNPSPCTPHPAPSPCALTLHPHPAPSPCTLTLHPSPLSPHSSLLTSHLSPFTLTLTLTLTLHPPLQLAPCTLTLTLHPHAKQRSSGGRRPSSTLSP